MSSINGISFGGLASGLDTDSILRQLVALERRPIGLLQDRKSNFSKQKNLLADLESKLEKLSSASKALRDTSTFLDFAASTDNEDKFLTASAGSGATPGTYDLKVSQLATAQINSSSGSADSNQVSHGQGFLRFDRDGEDPVFVDVGDGTLDTIAANINASDAGVTAQVVDTGIGANKYKLVLTGTETGTDNAVTLSTDSADAALDSFVAELNTNPTAAANAKVNFNGIDIERSSNTFSDLIQGVTITLKGADATNQEVTKLTIATDTEATSEKLKSFVEAYNEVLDFIAEQQKVSTSSSSSGDSDNESTSVGPLFGDSSLSTIKFGLRGLLGGSVATGNEAYSLLAQVGIETDRDGKLTFNQSEFEEALVDDEQAVRNLFTDSASGLARRVYSTIENYTDPLDGLITSRTKGIDSTIKDINSQIERAEDRVKRQEELLQARFANLELLIGRLNSQAGALVSLQ